eukprot:CAMPEP_0177526958 /NCGR_PEP_ID=MMETSP0369-20130122/51367_1 /TAXON_ID=447022 ORGANISM="Scrippsiella hangoei-like, Strain SHHI-4" /NCGR_SAMPLE_ID=MMETSP0369 /ASSEMBLY_ACC=CAM_ASM_000364 /LENGTH=115 /DNA_ID=CAMNT_0019007229 /DNA_START=250 /DNA_END=597 /DNA_ORIENTATION=+
MELDAARAADVLQSLQHQGTSMLVHQDAEATVDAMPVNSGLERRDACRNVLWLRGSRSHSTTSCVEAVLLSSTPRAIVEHPEVPTHCTEPAIGSPPSPTMHPRFWFLTNEAGLKE